MITVLMPTYNNAEYVETAVRSILAQSFADFEFLIIDDCSTDNTVDIIKSFSDTRIRLIINTENTGLGNTLNKGLAEARYELVGRMDGDDISLPDRLAKQYEFMTNNKDIDVLSCRYAMFSGNRILYTVKTYERHEDIKKRLALHSEIIHPGVMYRKNSILDNGGYSNCFIEDYELWLRLKDKIRFHNLADFLLLKRYHGKSISLDIERKNKSVYSYTEKYFAAPSDEFGTGKKTDDILRGWREYFYGSKKLARKYFIKSPLRMLLSPRIFAGFLATLLSEDLFRTFKEMRFRFRMVYLLGFLSGRNRRLRKYLKEQNIH